MYQQPLHSQQTWSGVQFAQTTMPSMLYTASAPVITTMQGAPATAVSHQSFVPPAPPEVNLLQWQNGMWMYTAPAGSASSSQAHDAYPPPTILGWNIPDSWGITSQYYHPQAAQVQKQQKQPDRSYWDTKLSNNGLGLENMHVKQKPGRTVSGEGKDTMPHTPWAWVPRELDDNSHSQQAGSAAQYQNAQRPQRPKPVASDKRSNGATSSATVGGTSSYPGQKSQRHGHGYTVPSHAYVSVPADQQPRRQQQQQNVVYYIAG